MYSHVGRHVVANIELYLTAAGLVIAFGVPLVLGPSHFWQAVAVAALTVSTIHGLLFWTVRRRQRILRQELLTDVRGMLKDRINDQLQALFDKAVSVRVGRADSPLDSTAAEIADVFEATRAVARTVDQLSVESLDRWQDRPRARA